MNNPNPFVPKGSLLEQQNLRRSRLKITVGCVLAVSVVGLFGMLIEGCKRENPDTNSTPPAMDTNALPPAMDTNTPPPPATNVAEQMPPPVAPSNNPVLQPTQPVPQINTQPPAEPAAASTYEIVAGDTLGKIAKAHGVSLKALEAANPGVDSKKLKVKEKINIPAASATAEATPGAPAAAGAPSVGGETYVVKSNDNLIKIAKKNGVKVKALKAANNLTTDHIKVGQKLIIPAKTETASSPAMPDTTTSPVPMQPVPSSTPTATSSPTAAPVH